MNDALVSAVESKLSGLASSLTTKLRKDALSARWPRKAAASLSVVVSDRKLQISYPKNMAKQIEDLEYGSVAGIANPVLRKFTTANESLIDSTVVEAVSDYVMGSENIL